MEQNREIRPLRVLFYILLIAPFFQLELIINLIPIAGKAYTLWQLLAGAAFAYIWFKESRSLKVFSWIHILFALLLAVITVSSAINPDASLKRAVEYSYGCMAVGLFTEFGIRKDRHHFLTGMEILFGVLVFCNVVTIILYPQGMYVYDIALHDNWLLGYKNFHIVYIMALLIFSSVHSLIREGRIGIRVWAFIVLSAVSCILVGARTPLLAVMMFAVSVAAEKLLTYTKIFNAFVYLGAYAAAFFAIVVVRVQNLPFITERVGHEITFNNRTFFWDKAMTQFHEYPVFGHGYEQFVMFTGFVTTHNQIIEILFKAGIVGLVIFVLILLATAYRLYVNRNGRCTRFLAVFFAGFLVLFLMEQYSFADYFYLFVLAFCAELLDYLTREAAEKRAAEQGDKG